MNSWQVCLVLAVELVAARVLSAESVLGVLNQLLDASLDGEVQDDLRIYFAWMVSATTMSAV